MSARTTGKRSNCKPREQTSPPDMPVAAIRVLFARSPEKMWSYIEECAHRLRVRDLPREVDRDDLASEVVWRIFKNPQRLLETYEPTRFVHAWLRVYLRRTAARMGRQLLTRHEKEAKAQAVRWQTSKIEDPAKTLERADYLASMRIFHSQVSRRFRMPHRRIAEMLINGKSTADIHLYLSGALHVGTRRCEQVVSETSAMLRRASGQTGGEGKP